MELKKIYLDMDGVIVNLDQHLADLEHITLEELHNINARMNNDHYNHILHCINKHLHTHPFIFAPKMDDMDFFLRSLEYYCYNRDIEIEILSSITQQPYSEEIKNQKLEWLKINNIKYKPNFSEGSKSKAKYANGSVLLIDDFYSNIIRFRESGGHAIHFKNAPNTMMDLYELFK